MTTRSVSYLLTIASTHEWQLAESQSGYIKTYNLYKEGRKITLIMNHRVKMDQHEPTVQAALIDNGQYSVIVNNDHINMLAKFILRDNWMVKL